MNHKPLAIAIIALTCTMSSWASVRIVTNHNATGRIITDTATVSSGGAALLCDVIKRISGATIPVTTGRQYDARRGDIVITNDNRLLPEDGFRLSTADGVLTIDGGPDKGALYGAVTLLEKYLGVMYFGDGQYLLTESPTVEFPDMDFTDAPAFRYRQSQNYVLRNDPTYRAWMRLEEPRDEFAAGLWVHTSEALLPSGVYGDSHPEYYSWINGARRPGRASQWCLTNEEVFATVAARIDSIFDANPGRNMISVSQNDGNHTYCTCPECLKVLEEEGSPSGAYIRFLNRLAERRPDKQFSTLAYLFTMQPPRVTKPLPNVNIMLCDIDAKREVPLTDNASGREFVKALEGWASMSDNIYVWDYGINFDNYLSPFPNIPVLKKNMQLFRDNHVKMHFSQIASVYGGDFAELRTYLVSKLMWNPDADVDSLTHRFMDGYYGAAAPFIYDYEKLLEGALLGSGKELWIYDSPVTHKDGMLNAALRGRYNELFDSAEAAVADDPLRLERVRRQRLTLQYSTLEIARAEGRAAAPENLKLLDVFEERIKAFGIPSLNERNNSPVDYCNLYRERYVRTDSSNMAVDANITWGIEPSGKYRTMNPKVLADGIYGGTTYVESWVGWEGRDGEILVDLGEVKPVSSVKGDFLHQLGAWIFFPRSFEVETSVDGKSYRTMGRVEIPEDREPKVKFRTIGVDSPQPIDARYLKIKMGGIELCPSWHYGVGSPGWIFIDELTVN